MLCLFPKLGNLSDSVVVVGLVCGPGCVGRMADSDGGTIGPAVRIATGGAGAAGRPGTGRGGTAGSAVHRVMDGGGGRTRGGGGMHRCLRPPTH